MVDQTKCCAGLNWVYDLSSQFFWGKPWERQYPCLWGWQYQAAACNVKWHLFITVFPCFSCCCVYIIMIEWINASQCVLNPTLYLSFLANPQQPCQTTGVALFGSEFVSTPNRAVCNSCPKCRTPLTHTWAKLLEFFRAWSSSIRS